MDVLPRLKGQFTGGKEMKNTTPGLDLKHSSLLMLKIKGGNENLGLPD